MMSKYKAEIIGLLCAEGNYYDKRSSYFEYYKNKQKYYYKTKKRNVYIQFANFNLGLLDQFQNLIKLEYNYDVKIHEDRIRICKRDVINDLISYSDYGCLKWEVPSDIMNNNNLAIPFLRGYFEGDGCANKVRFSSSNIKGLIQVKKILDSLEITNTIQGPWMRLNREPNYELYIWKNSWNKFFEVIKPVFKTKTL